MNWIKIGSALKATFAVTAVMTACHVKHRGNDNHTFLLAKSPKEVHYAAPPKAFHYCYYYFICARKTAASSSSPVLTVNRETEIERRWETRSCDRKMCWLIRFCSGVGIGSWTDHDIIAVRPEWKLTIKSCVKISSVRFLPSQRKTFGAHLRVCHLRALK